MSASHTMREIAILGVLAAAHDAAWLERVFAIVEDMPDIAGMTALEALEIDLRGEVDLIALCARNGKLYQLLGNVPAKGSR